MVDLGAEYLHGLQTAQSAIEARDRLSAERSRIQMETQARQQTLQQENLMQNARLQTEKAYHDAEIGLAQARLNEAAQLHAARAKEAATKMAAQVKFDSLLKNGMSVQDALSQVPELSTPTTAINAHKDAEDLGRQRLELARQKAADEQSSREQALKLREQKRGNIGHMSLQLPPAPGSESSFGSTMEVPLDSPLINKVLGTNAPPGTGTNYQDAAAPDSPVAPPVRQSGGEMVSVISPGGKRGKIPAANLQKAKAKGYKLADDSVEEQ